MPSRKQNCPFCDSPHHVAFDCFNSLNGRRVILDKCMMSQEIPDFQSYTKKELKLVAYITPYKDTMARISGKRYSGYDPISLTLSKSRLVERLIDRWNTLEAMRHTYYRPPHGEECPICYESPDQFYWSITKGKWKKKHKLNEYIKVTTKCNHTYCKKCWDSIHSSSYYDDDKKCPMCRENITSNDITLKY